MFALPHHSLDGAEQKFAGLRWLSKLTRAQKEFPGNLKRSLDDPMKRFTHESKKLDVTPRVPVVICPTLSLARYETSGIVKR